jgi:DNA repair protein RadA/Sms
VLEHIVDTVLYFEGDTHSSFRLIRAFKNRFGAVNELGVFAMTDKGLRGVVEPIGAVPVAARAGSFAGSCVLCHAGRHAAAAGGDPGAGRHGSHSPSPRRLTVGLDAQNRLAMLLAVLHRHAGIVCFDQDVFVNAVGGVQALQEPAADLAVLLAIVSSLRNNRPLPGEAGRLRRRSAWPARFARRRAGRNASKKRPSWASPTRMVPKANAPKQRRSRASRSSRWSASNRPSSRCEAGEKQIMGRGWRSKHRERCWNFSLCALIYLDG